MRLNGWMLTGLLAITGCGGDDGEAVGASCEVADDCYGGVEDPAELSGPITCLDRVEGGYCTHDCAVDEDCCAVPGECSTDRSQVCAPFESTGFKRCFLSCEADVIGDQDESDYCAEFAHREFGCRSTGGGSENRKVCVP